MKRFLIALFALFLCPQSAQANGPLVTFNEKNFENFAAQYGNKSANLNELCKIIAQVPTGRQKIYTVPSFIALSDHQIKQHLIAMRLPTNRPSASPNVLALVNQLWTRFKTVQRRQSVITPEGKALLANIRQEIITAFNQNPFSSHDLNVFLNQALRSNQLLMVRSTGKEDTKQLANAGGNESIAAVKPDGASVNNAIGLVLASYFSEKSINQRMIDQGAQLDDPFLPVLIQVMIGENPNNPIVTKSDIPVSGVIFSQEPAGNTQGIIDIRATYGHGEAVVNGIIPTDAYFVATNDTIQSLIKVKPSRLVPNAGFTGLSTQANPRVLQKIAVFDRETLLDLAQITRAVETYYGYPVDIEFVVSHNIIYLIQARPIVIKSATPSYLKHDYLNTLSAAQKQPVFVIGAASNQVVVLNNKQEYIMTTTLAQALDIFLNMPDKNKIKAIIVHQESPATSHEATTFRAAQKPVVYHHDLSGAQQWIDSGSFPLLLDVQRGLIVPHIRTNRTTDLRRIITQGWTCHPISKKASICPEFFTAYTPRDLQTIAPREFYPQLTFVQLLEQIKQGNYQESNQALRSLVYRVCRLFEKYTKDFHEKQRDNRQINPLFFDQLQHAFIAFNLAALQTHAALNTWDRSAKTQTDYLARLYPVVFLEAFFLQQPASGICVDDHSLTHLISIEKSETQVSNDLNLQQTPYREYVALYAPLKKYGLHEDTQKLWTKYLTHLAQINNRNFHHNIATMMYTLTTLNLTPFWINTAFAQAALIPATVLETTEQLYTQFLQSREFLNQLAAIKQQLDMLDVQSWQDQHVFVKQWQSFHNTFITYFSSPDFIAHVDNGTPLVKNAAVAVMQQAVDIFDRSIKALKSSTAYDMSLKLERFKIMLQGYCSLLRCWTHIPCIQGTLETLRDTLTFIDVSNYINAIEKFINENPMTQDQLAPSASFNVSAAVLGSKALWGRSVYGTQIHSDPTREDMFTLVHQNLLVVLSQLTCLACQNALKVPQLLEDTKFALEHHARYTCNLIGMDYDYPYLTYFYNMPLRNHSTTLQVIYDVSKQETSCAVQFLGAARARWDRIHDLIREHDNQIALIKRPEIDAMRGIVSWVWQIQNNAQIELIINLLDYCAAITF